MPKFKRSFREELLEFYDDGPITGTMMLVCYVGMALILFILASSGIVAICTHVLDGWEKSKAVEMSSAGVISAKIYTAPEVYRCGGKVIHDCYSPEKFKVSAKVDGYELSGQVSGSCFDQLTGGHPVAVTYRRFRDGSVELVNLCPPRHP